MARQLPIEIFMPPNILKAKVGSAAGGIDMAAIKRAEAAMETLKVEFHDWLASDVAQLGTSRDAFAAAPSATTREDLFRAAHDLKGEADTFEYPMIARMAASLTKLIDATNVSTAIPLGLVDAHVAAIRVVFREKIKTSTDRIATVLVEELEARVAEMLSGA
ncbi:MAG TPA: Hpt domain-containing protein [Rhizomicrobium sp.]|jgi:chemotaxis protein histidine kinase CheA|nr:Hpt domain-containing protein [Rhizomicrobium sp.]